MRLSPGARTHRTDHKENTLNAQTTEQPLAYMTGNHYPVLVTYYHDDAPYLETVTAPTHADAVRCAAYIYQGAHDIQVIPATVRVRISAPADPEEDTIPAVVLLAAALLASHAPAYMVTPAS